MLASRLYKWSRCTNPSTGLGSFLETYLRVCQESPLAVYMLNMAIDIFGKDGADRMHGKPCISHR